ncbi:hypothetical protein [Pseudomonas putida]|uniref:Uncharacterized protein n=1 Tax=Pseudomonas putida TaxID=303 RepID=A0A6I6XCM6_PSEPU|nr:hypothetical protein [Pseudomonas putida]QHG63268.1 hypothetical protein C2H86_02070 [Pseudomonas putida]
MTIVHLTFLVYSLAFATLTFLNLAITIFIAHRKIDYIEGFLLNCDAVIGERKLWLHAGLMGKVIRLNNISFILLCPKIYTYRKLINIEEINKLPSKIKFPLIGIGIANTVSFIALVGLGVFMHYLPPLAK